MVYKKILFAVAAFTLASLVSACGPAYYYTIEQPSAPADPIKAASEFKVRHIDFSAINPADLQYEKAEDWQKEIANMPNDLAEHFPVLLKEEGIDKKVTVIPPSEEVTEGIVVDVKVKQITLNWNAWSAQPDDFLCEVIFTDAASKQALFKAQVNVNNRAGNPYTQGWGAMSFASRLNTAAYNIAWVLVKIMNNGNITPEKY